MGLKVRFFFCPAAPSNALNPPSCRLYPNMSAVIIDDLSNVSYYDDANTRCRRERRL